MATYICHVRNPHIYITSMSHGVGLYMRSLYFMYKLLYKDLVYLEWNYNLHAMLYLKYGNSV